MPHATAASRLALSQPTCTRRTSVEIRAMTTECDVMGGINLPRASATRLSQRWFRMRPSEPSTTRQYLHPLRWHRTFAPGHCR